MLHLLVPSKLSVHGMDGKQSVNNARSQLTCNDGSISFSVRIPFRTQPNHYHSNLPIPNDVSSKNSSNCYSSDIVQSYPEVVRSLLLPLARYPMKILRRFPMPRDHDDIFPAWQNISLRDIFSLFPYTQYREECPKESNGIELLQQHVSNNKRSQSAEVLSTFSTQQASLANVSFDDKRFSCFLSLAEVVTTQGLAKLGW